MLSELREHLPLVIRHHHAIRGPSRSRGTTVSGWQAAAGAPDWNWLARSPLSPPSLPVPLLSLLPPSSLPSPPSSLPRPIPLLLPPLLPSSLRSEGPRAPHLSPPNLRSWCVSMKALLSSASVETQHTREGSGTVSDEAAEGVALIAVCCGHVCAREEAHRAAV